PGYLLGEQVDHAAPQVERIRDEAEQAVGGLRAGELGRRQVVVELVDHVVADLGTGAAQHNGVLLEAQARRPLDGGHHLLHRLAQLGFVPDLLRPLLASGAPRSNPPQQRPGAQPAGPHACHSIPFPMAVPTTRATSCPRTIMPWFSSCLLRRRSSSSRLSARVGGGRWTAVEGGGGPYATFPSP